MDEGSYLVLGSVKVKDSEFVLALGRKLERKSWVVNDDLGILRGWVDEIIPNFLSSGLSLTLFSKRLLPPVHVFVVVLIWQELLVVLSQILLIKLFKVQVLGLDIISVIAS